MAGLWAQVCEYAKGEQESSEQVGGTGDLLARETKRKKVDPKAEFLLQVATCCLVQLFLLLLLLSVGLSAGWTGIKRWKIFHRHRRKLLNDAKQSRQISLCIRRRRRR